MKTKFFLFLIALSLGLNAMAADGDTYVMGDLTYTVTSEANREVSVKATSQGISGNVEIPLYIQTDSNGRYLVTSIDRDAFQYCSSLTSINIPESVTAIGERAFQYCEALISINIPESVTSIGDYAFEDCHALTSINLPESVTSIGDWAFNKCTALTSIDLPTSVTSIGKYAFYECEALTSIIIPENVTSIGNGVFYGCSALTYINIPKNVTTIGEEAFSDCQNLIEITVDKNNNYFCSVSGCLYNKDCSELIRVPERKNSIDIPESVTSIWDYALSGCSSLTSINIPDGVTSIGEYAFSNCSSLTSINIPDGVTSIATRAFLSCTSLTSINIPNGVTLIGWAAFGNCSSLTSINIPESVTSIDYTAFSGCSNLETIYDFNPEPQSLGGSYVFGGVPSAATIYVPKQSVNRYLVTPGWDYFSDFRALDNVVIMPAATSLTLDQGETFQMWAKTHFAYDTETITSEKWQSLDRDIATISTDGLVTGRTEGETQVRCAITTLNGTYYTSCKISVTDQAGIGDIIADEPAAVDTPAEYFTLQGVRVNADNLTPGIYIVRQGNTAKKVLVK